MNDVLIPFSVLGTIFAGLYFILKAIMEYLLRKRMIENGFVKKENMGIFQSSKSLSSKYLSLKIGMVIFALGIGLVLIEYIPYHRGDSPLPFGIVGVCIAISLLIYHFITKKDLEEGS
ncbi:hypothetical protein QQ008_04655 [Fulvivirgaceae bacterium BMA10]|uniref:DUF3784 domain-containing protein n=1 Tax=Splendidivirga corallicola TaxID=3051826 RepID=A0ABT8KIU0_9BACT|nr:hypothetical protein [Fulvivirgaceae bacterium BMA10]